MPLTEQVSRCRDVILSEDYADFIVAYGGDAEVTRKVYDPVCYEIVNSGFLVMHKPVDPDALDALDDYPYNILPDVMGLLDVTSMEQSGVLPIHYRPGPGFLGQGVMVGIIDTGIDYTHPVFRYSDGSSRILSIWDQTIQSENVPEKFPYGTLYTQDMINNALTLEEPRSLVPTVDTDGHGTFLAGIMAGGEDTAMDFVGAAPQAGIAVVKLKQAKRYLRNYYMVPEDAVAFQETDVFMAIQHLLQESLRYQMPLVICIGIGNTLNSHEGTSNLSQYLDALNNLTGVSVILAAGNELGIGHHYSGFIPERDASDTIELKVGEQERGFQMEIWGGLSDVFSVEIISPEGERIARSQSLLGQPIRVRLLFEDTEIFIANKSEGLTSGRFLMVIQLKDPTPGIWTFRIFGERVVDGHIHVWLPMEKFMNPETFFLNPDPEMTIMSGASTRSTVTVSNYSHYNDRLNVKSSKGYTLSGTIKPDMAAPGTDVFGPVPGGRFEKRTGSSISAAHAAGAAALLFQWGLLGGIIINMDGNDIRRLLIQGAIPKGGEAVPNRGWGYGAMNLKNTFETLRIVR